MTDKELIKQEIERLYRHYLDAQEFDSGYNMALDGILQFIDSLPEEPASEDLEEAVSQYIKENKCYETDDVETDIVAQYIMKKAFKAGAEWQKQQDYKMYAHVPLKDIHDAWQELKKNKPDIENYPAICFQKGADWRENQMQEVLQTEYEKGRFDMREEMIKNVVETIIVNDWQYGKDPDHAVIPAIHQRIKGFNVGDKVKIIIVKEDK